MLKRYDKNEDHKITWEEFSAYMQEKYGKNYMTFDGNGHQRFYGTDFRMYGIQTVL